MSFASSFIGEMISVPRLDTYFEKYRNIIIGLMSVYKNGRA